MVRFRSGAAHISCVQQTTNSECEQNCRDILARYWEGSIEEHEARSLIAEQLHQLGLAKVVAGEQGLMAAQLFHDLVYNLEGLLYRKIMGEGSSSLDLEVDNTKSVIAWARNLLRTARPSEMRNIYTRGAAHVELVDPQTPDIEPASTVPGGTLWMHPAARFHTVATVDEYDLTSGGGSVESMNDAAEWLQDKARHLRDNSRLEANAATLRHGYGLPPLIRPRLAERQRLQDVLRTDRFSAHRAVRELSSIINGDPYVGAKADKGLLCLWDDFSPGQLEAVASAPGKVALTLVEAVLAERPRPSRAAQRSFRSAAREFGSGKGWPSLIDEACECFVALEFEACSAFDSTAAEFRDARIAGQTILQKKSADVFARVLAWPGQAFGSTEDELYDRLDALIRSMTDLEVEVASRKAA